MHHAWPSLFVFMGAFTLQGLHHMHVAMSYLNIYIYIDIYHVLRIVHDTGVLTLVIQYCIQVQDVKPDKSISCYRGRAALSQHTREPMVATCIGISVQIDKADVPCQASLRSLSQRPLSQSWHRANHPPATIRQQQLLTNLDTCPFSQTPNSQHRPSHFDLIAIDCTPSFSTWSQRLRWGAGCFGGSPQQQQATPPDQHTGQRTTSQLPSQPTNQPNKHASD